MPEPTRLPFITLSQKPTINPMTNENRNTGERIMRPLVRSNLWVVSALRLLLAGFVVGSIFGGHARAQSSYTWRPVAIGAGGFITGLDFDPSGTTRVIRTDVYGAYIWHAETDRWVQLVTRAGMPSADHVQNGLADGVFEIVVAPSNPNRIFLAIKGRLYRSDDRGRTFIQTTRAAPIPIEFDANSEFRFYGPYLAVSPDNPDVIMFGTPHVGLLRSSDAGASWQRVNSVPIGANLRSGKAIRSPGVIVAFEPGKNGRVLAMSAGHGVFISDNQGASFAPLVPEGAEQPKTIKQLAFAGNGVFFAVDREAQKIWRYAQGTWTDLTRKPGLTGSKYAAIAVNPGNSQVFVFDDGGRAHRSSHNGDVWSRLPHRARVGSNDPPWLRVSNQSYFATSRVFFDPTVPDRLWNAAGTGMYYADLAANAEQVVWTSLSRGIEELVANDVIHAPGQAPLFAAWDFGIHRKDDLQQFSKTYGPKERVIISAQQMDWSPSRPGFVVTNASDHRRCCSEDGDTILAGYSLDGGLNWSKFPTLPTPAGTEKNDPWRMSFGSIAVNSADIDNIIWLPSMNRTPFFTKNRGTSWQPVVLPGEQGPLTGSHARYHFARRTMTADRVLPGVFYYVHSGEERNAALTGLWRTQNGGESWTKIFEGEIAPQSRFSAKLRAVPGKAGHLFFTSGVERGPDLRLRRSLDGGKTWIALANVSQIDDVGFGRASTEQGYPTIFVSGRVSGRYGIWRSTDNAASWSRLADFPFGKLDQVTVIEGDKDVFGRVYIGYKGSGWVFGEPTACKPERMTIGAGHECQAVLISP
jgi:photosystem II stability/assembly factor-like uncharacterized protein